MLDGASDRYGFVGGDIIEPLSTGDYTLVAEVTHVSSSASPIYDWDVTFTITDDRDVCDNSYCKRLSRNHGLHTQVSRRTNRTSRR